MTPGPELYPSAPPEPRPGGPASRRLNGEPTGAWDGVRLIEWELTGATWTDRHVHDEYNYVIEGELVVECDGIEVVAGPGDVVRVPGGTRGRYRAPRHARMLAVYGPNPDGEPATDLGYTED